MGIRGDLPDDTLRTVFDWLESADVIRYLEDITGYYPVEFYSCVDRLRAKCGVTREL